MTLRQIAAAVGEAAWLVFILVLAIALAAASFFAIGYLAHLGWVASS